MIQSLTVSKGAFMQAASFLADADILALAEGNQPLITPFDPTAVQPASVDLRLSGERYVYHRDTYRLGDEISETDFTRETFTELSVQPQETVYVGLLETILIPPSAVGFVVARSSVTRLGLRIAPVFMNPGYRGRMPLTLTNASSFVIQLVPQVRVAQLVCAQLSTTPSRNYSGAHAKYADEDVFPSRLHTDNDVKEALDRVLRSYFSDDVVKTVE